MNLRDHDLPCVHGNTTECGYWNPPHPIDDVRICPGGAEMAVDYDAARSELEFYGVKHSDLLENDDIDKFVAIIFGNESAT